MNDYNSDQNNSNNQPTTSYVDDYTPPASTSYLPQDSQDPQNGADPQASSDQWGQADPQAQPQQQAQADQQTDEVQQDLPDQSADQSDFSEESLEVQNIFFMLHVEEGDDELKEKFLDQLQDVIWDDFLNNDVELLLTQEEVTQFKNHRQAIESATGEEQEKAKDALVEFLEKLIPDLEDIMLEKALDLKADLFAERIAGMKEYFAQKPDQLEQVKQAEQLMSEDKWKSAASLLNSVTD